MLIFTQPNASFVPLAKSMQTKHDRHSATLILIVTYAFLGFSIYRFVRVPPLLTDPLQIAALAAGSLCTLVGVILRVWSIRTLGAFFTTDLRLQEQHSLVQDGPYHWMRHPSYTGAIAIMAAPLFSYGQWLIAPFGIAALVGGYAYRIHAEEQMLMKRFGSEYFDYRKRVSRLIPFLF